MLDIFRVLLCEIPNSISAGAAPQTPLWELTSLPRLPSWIKGPSSKEKGREGEGSRDKGRGGKPGEGRGRDPTPSRPPNPYFWIRLCNLLRTNTVSRGSKMNPVYEYKSPIAHNDRQQPSRILYDYNDDDTHSHDARLLASQ